jgi:hypothetical protein
VRARKRKSRKRGVGGLMGKGLMGPGHYWGGVIVDRFRNRERGRRRGGDDADRWVPPGRERERGERVTRV